MLWLWCRPAAVAPTGPLDWEPPYATGAALKSKNKKKKKREREREREREEEEEEEVDPLFLSQTQSNL